MKKKNSRLKMLIDLTNGDEAFIREMLGIFIKTTPSTISNINSSLKEKNYSSVGDHAHKLKSSIQILGDKNLHDLVREIEKTAKTTNNSTELEPLIEELNNEILLLLSWMKERLEDPEKFT